MNSHAGAWELEKKIEEKIGILKNSGYFLLG